MSHQSRWFSSEITNILLSTRTSKFRKVRKSIFRKQKQTKYRVAALNHSLKSKTADATPWSLSNSVYHCSEKYCTVTCLLVYLEALEWTGLNSDWEEKNDYF